MAVFHGRPGSRVIATWSGFAVLALGLLGLIGNIYSITALSSISASFAAMKPVTAFSLILLGTAILASRNRWVEFVAAASMMVVLSMAVVTFAAVFSDTGLRAAFFNESIIEVNTTSPGIPALGSIMAMTFAAGGMVIWVVGNGPLRPIRRACSLVVMVTGVAAVFGYITGVDILYWNIPGVSSAMALHAAFAFVALGLGVHEVEFSRAE